MTRIPTLVFCLLLASSLGAQDVLVAPSGTYTTIQSAIDAAQNGDVVEVPWGIYSESLDLLGKEITLRSQSGPEITMLGGPQRKIRARSGETRNTRIEGFTFTGQLGGYWSTIEVTSSGLTVVNCLFDSIVAGMPAQSAGNFAPAITSMAGNLLLVDCRFLNCQAASASDSISAPFPSSGASGGAILAAGGKLEVLRCQFSGNVAGKGGSDLGGSAFFSSGTNGGRGGAIELLAVDTTIRECFFDGNRAGDAGLDGNPAPISQNGIAGSGGAIHAVGMNGISSPLVILDSFFLDNETGRESYPPFTLAAEGGAVDAESVRLSIQSSFFCGNGANLGGAVMTRPSGIGGDAGNFDLVNSVLVGNEASGHGGAVYLRRATDADLLHSVFVANGAAAGAAVYSADSGPASPRIGNSIFRESWGADFESDLGMNGSGAIFSFNLSDQILPAGLGNLVDDPDFVDAEGLDFRLRPESPAIDSGGALAGSPLGDYDGEPRPFGAQPDIGADEYVGLSAAAAGTVPDGAGGLADVITVDGGAGGNTRYLVMPIGSRPTWQIDTTPTSADPDHFILWGRIGLPAFGESYPIWFLGADLCFTPHLMDVGNPLLFTFANSFQPVGSGIVSAYPAPFGVTAPPITFPITITVQGLILDDLMQFHVTNAIAVEIR